MSTDDETLRVYDSRAVDYVNLVAEATLDADMRAFLQPIPEGGHVLDLGCGPGNAAAAMRDQGYKVDAWDASPEMVATARTKFGIAARLASFDDLDAVDVYDGVWANFSLLHAPKADMPRYLAAIHRALKPAGHLHIGLKTGEGEKRDAIGRFYAYYADADITELLHSAGFAVTARRTGEEKGLDGVVAPWIILTAVA